MTVTEDDIKRVVKGPADLEEQIDQLKKQVSFLQDKCRQAGTIIRDLELQKSSLSKEFDRLSEENDNLRIMMKSKKNGAEK
jgi:chromosome segregation ATPase|tara:strand:+ start:133 stop:375 length:243 start_codon:yes stop_codon:yes gene_type:complete